MASSRNCRGPTPYQTYPFEISRPRSRAAPFVRISIRITKPDEASRPASRMEGHDDRSHHLRPRANAARTRETGWFAAHGFDPPFGVDRFEGDQGSQPS